MSSEVVTDFSSKIIVHDVLEVNFIEIVGPWMEHREALMLDTLAAELADIVPQELKVCLVGRDGVRKIVLDDFFLGVADETTDGFDARGTLQILGLYLEVKKTSHFVILLDTNCFKYSHKHLLESLEIPVLVDACVSDA